MPKIDAMLKMMSEKAVDHAVLRGGKPYQVRAGGRVVNGSVTPNAQLREMLEEIVSSAQLPGLRSGASFSFRYPSPYGAFDISVSNDLGAHQITIAPAKISSPIAVAVPSHAPPLSPPAPSPYVPPSAIVPVTPWAPPPVSAPPLPVPPAPQIIPSPYPGYAPPSYQPYPFQSPPVSHRSKVSAGLLALFLPGLGVHRFYLGYSGAGLAFLFLTFILSWVTCGITAGIAGIWGTIEGIIILCGGMNDAEGRTLY